MKILVTGARGFVGHKLMEHFRDAVAAPSFRNASKEEVQRIVEESGADIVIHTAAISDIGTCARNPEASYHANVLLPVFLARACEKRKLICFSSDQVYSACAEEGPYREETVCPGNLYAEEKLEMERKVLAIQPFGCMANHVAGRGIYASIQRKRGGAVVSADVDASGTPVNVYNRARMLIDLSETLL